MKDTESYNKKHKVKVGNWEIEVDFEKLKDIPTIKLPTIKMVSRSNLGPYWPGGTYFIGPNGMEQWAVWYDTQGRRVTRCIWTENAT